MPMRSPPCPSPAGVSGPPDGRDFSIPRRNERPPRQSAFDLGRDRFNGPEYFADQSRGTTEFGWGGSIPRFRGPFPDFPCRCSCSGFGPSSQPARGSVARSGQTSEAGRPRSSRIPFGGPVAAANRPFHRRRPARVGPVTCKKEAVDRGSLGWSMRFDTRPDRKRRPMLGDNPRTEQGRLASRRPDLGKLRHDRGENGRLVESQQIVRGADDELEVFSPAPSPLDLGSPCD